MQEEFDFVSFLKSLRSGENTICPKCKRGHMIPQGNYQTTHAFSCSECKAKLNIN